MIPALATRLQNMGAKSVVDGGDVELYSAEDEILKKGIDKSIY